MILLGRLMWQKLFWEENQSIQIVEILNNQKLQRPYF